MPLKRPALAAGQKTQQSKLFVEASQFDKAKLRFLEPTSTKAGSTWIPIEYDQTRLLLHTGLVNCPFGASQYEKKVSPTAFSMQISIDDDNTNALALGTVMKSVMDALKEHIPNIVEAPAGGIEYVDTCQQNSAQYAPLARVTLPLFKNNFTTQIVRRNKTTQAVKLTLSNWEKVLGPCIVDGVLRLAGAYYHEENNKARAGVSWQWHSIRLADEDELQTTGTSERKAENAAVAEALLASAPLTDDSKKKRKNASTADGSGVKRAKTVHDDCEIEGAPEEEEIPH